MIKEEFLRYNKEADMTHRAFLQQIADTAIAGSPLVLAIDLEETLLEQYISGYDFIIAPPHNNPNLVNFLSALITDRQIIEKVSQIFFANASRMAADPKSLTGLNRQNAVAYMSAGENILAGICSNSNLVSINELRRLSKLGTIIHINDMEVYPELAALSPTGWQTYAAKVTPFYRNDQVVDYKTYVEAIQQTYGQIDAEKIASQIAKQRALLLQTFR